MKTSSLIKLLAFILILLIGNIAPAFSQGSEKLFQKGLVKEEGEGSLQEAIDIYNQIVEDASAERSLRAKALLHVGFCYEKLGQEKAKKTYQKLIADFADQEEIVAIGKKKLSYLDAGVKVTKSDDLIMRKVWSSFEDTYGVTPNGRYVSYVDWDTPELAVKDLQTGKSWNITNFGSWETWSYPDHSVLAPDSKQIAYFWYNGPVSELHIASLDGSEDRIIFKSEEHKYDDTPWPVGWSPDGKYILAVNTVEDNTKLNNHYDQVVLVSVKDGSIQVVKSFDELHTNHMCFSPDGRYIAVDLQQEKNSGKKDIYLLATDQSYEARIVNNPANDWNTLWTPDGSGILFLSDRMGMTDLWTLQLDNGIPQGEPEIVKSNLGANTFFLGITNDKSLYFGNGNSRRDIYIAKLDFNSGEILSEPKRISSTEEWRYRRPIWSPDGRYVAYLNWKRPVVNQNLGIQIKFVIHDTKTNNDRELITDLYGTNMTWPRWSPDGKFLMLHANTNEDRLDGFFLVDVKTGERTSILAKERDPAIWIPSEGYFPNFTNNGKDILYLTGDMNAIIKRNLATRDEKKIFSSEDRILQFKVSPDESQIIFGYETNNRNELYSISSSGGEIKKLAGFDDDVTPQIISWTPYNKHVIIKVPGEFLRIPVEGGDPERVLLCKDLFSQGSVGRFEVHPDGQQVAIEIQIDQGAEIWALENLFEK